MNSLRPLLALAAAMLLASQASAQVSLAPPPATPPDKSTSPLPNPAIAAKPKAKPAASAKKSTAPQPQATPAATVAPAEPDDPNLDLVYGAYQRGFYKTAFELATKRAQENGDPKAMTMLGEL
ncbi:MAG TPA: HcpA family protein, partial [Bradyrhizobium sp.]|nr:HcpA family protein [Bradyrhizobium sp.]